MLRLPENKKNAGPRNAGNAGMCVALSADGRLAAASAPGNALLVWHLDRPEDEPVQLQGHNDALTAICFHPTRSEVFTASRDGGVRRWSLSGEFEASVEIAFHEKGAVKLAISPDGKYIASLGGDGGVLMSMVSTADLAEIVTRKVRRNLTQAEWNRYVGKDFPYEATVSQLP
jgi:WD40 repeat protein